MRTYKKMAVFCAMAVLLSGCGQASTTTTTSQTSESTTSVATVTPTSINPDELFSDRDYEIGYDETTSAQIQLNGTNATSISDAVKISDGTITITDEGTYVFTGTLKDGMIIVDADDTDKVQIVLNGVTITKSDSAAIYIKEADKVFITTNADTENTLSNGGTYTAIDDNNIDAVIFSKADLTLNGAGTLTIQAEAGHGIVSKDDVIITSGTYTITAEKHGISAKDRIGIANGTFTIESGKDGIHAENSDDTSLGYAYIAAGTFHIEAQGDGISAENTLQIEDGTFNITTGEGSDAVDLSQKNSDQMMGGGRGMGDRPIPPSGDTSDSQMTPPSGDTSNGQMTPPEQPEQSSEAVQTTAKETESTSSTASDSETTDTTDTVSMKGLKASSALVINGGTFEIDTEDDGLHSNANVTVNSGTFTIATGDDGMHADSDLVITDGTIRITKSYEGLEGQTVTVAGGDINLVASDDGINAAGGNDQSGTTTFEGGRGGGDMFSSDSDAMITISGGTIIVNADGDGIDSNGSISVTGGETYVLGPNGTGNGMLDYDLDAEITGGIFVAVGSAEMAQNFGDSSTQGSILLSVDNQESGSVVKLLDSNKKELLSWTAEEAYSCVIISSPDIQKGSTYTVVAGTSETEVTMDSLIYGTGSEGGRGMNGGPGGGKNFNGQAPTDRKEQSSSTEESTAE